MKRESETTSGNHIARAIGRELDLIDQLTEQINNMRRVNLDPAKKNELMIPIIELKRTHRRRLKRILSEFDIELIPGALSSAG